jgi:hypothetical protein
VDEAVDGFVRRNRALIKRASAACWLANDLQQRVVLTLEEAEVARERAGDLHVATALGALRRSLRSDIPSLRPMHEAVWASFRRSREALTRFETPQTEHLAPGSKR